jgi:hypothetical protein
MLAHRQLLDVPSSSSAVEVIIKDDELLLEDSSELFGYEDRKTRLDAVIAGMVREAPSWDSEPATISAETANTARRFLRALPHNRALPKVAADGEGDLLFVWEPPYGSCIVTVQPGLLHLVDHPGTQYAEHIDAQPFIGRHIPLAILHALPLR